MRRDEFSPFRNCFKKTRRHALRDGKDFDLTLQDLKNCWDAQDGICPYTGWKIKLPEHTGIKFPVSPDSASLDRFDNSKGYSRGNIQFISLIANYAKNQFSAQELIDFCKAVAKNWE
jgi:hypothetical protein